MLLLPQVRGHPCDCQYPQYCDSQLGALPPTRIAQIQQQQQQQDDTSSTSVAQQQQTPSTAANGISEPTAGSSSNQEDADALAAAMEAVHVVQVYDAIAGHFSSTRFAVWPKVRAFLESLAPHGVVADVGCGNGKYFGVRRDLAVLGSDRSEGERVLAAHASLTFVIHE